MSRTRSDTNALRKPRSQPVAHTSRLFDQAWREAVIKDDSWGLHRLSSTEKDEIFSLHSRLREKIQHGAIKGLWLIDVRRVASLGNNHLCRPGNLVGHVVGRS